MALPEASIEALQRRGVLFIACNNALTFFYGMIAEARQLDAATVGADIRANLLPGVVVVPAMVIAIEKAQARGLAYNRQ
jgi:intracellular sulfur oxidation DsrE/DsrF family protein